MILGLSAIYQAVTRGCLVSVHPHIDSQHRSIPMAKHNGITIRMGAAYDEVTVHTKDGPMKFDRADLNKRKTNGDKAAKEQLYQLRKGVVDAFVMQGELHKARSKKQHKRTYSAARKAKQESRNAA